MSRTNDHSFSGLVGSMDSRLEQVERYFGSRGSGVRTSVQIDDLDDAVLSGTYWTFTTGVNGPNVGVGYHVQVTTDGYDRIVQEATSVTGDLSRMMRVFDGTSWGPWVEVGAPGDTGIVDLMQYTVGVDGDFEGQRQYDTIVLRGSFDNFSLPSGGTGIDFATMPEEWRPNTSGNMWGAAYLTGGRSGNAVIRPAGLMSIFNQSGSTITTAQWSITFFGDPAYRP